MGVSSQTRSRVMRVVGVVIMLAAVAVVVRTIANDEEGLELIKSVSPAALLGLFFLLAVDLVAQAYRYKLAVDEAAERQVPMWAWFRLFIVGRFLNALFPQAGNAYRGLRLKEDYGIPVTRYLSGLLGFTWLSTLLNLIVALVLILVLEPELQIGEVSAAGSVTVLLAVVAFAPLAVDWALKKLRIEKGALGWARRRAEDMIGSAVRIIRSRSTVLRFALAGSGGIVVATMAFAVAFDALELKASLTAVVLFYVLQQFGSYLHITPGNLGVLELFSGALASQIGIGLTGGLLVAALIRFARYGTLLIVGVSMGGLRALGRARELQAARATEQSLIS